MLAAVYFRIHIYIYTYVAGLTPAKFVLGENAKLICNRRSEAAYVGVLLAPGYRSVKRMVVPNFCTGKLSNYSISLSGTQYRALHRRRCYTREFNDRARVLSSRYIGVYIYANNLRAQLWKKRCSVCLCSIMLRTSFINKLRATLFHLYIVNQKFLG